MSAAAKLPERVWLLLLRVGGWFRGCVHGGRGALEKFGAARSLFSRAPRVLAEPVGALSASTGQSQRVRSLLIFALNPRAPRLTERRTALCCSRGVPLARTVTRCGWRGAVRASCFVRWTWRTVCPSRWVRRAMASGYLPFCFNPWGEGISPSGSRFVYTLAIDVVYTFGGPVSGLDVYTVGARGGWAIGRLA